MTNQETHRPPLLLIKGDATDEEVAAVVAVLQAATGSPAPAPAPNAWAEARRGLRTTPPPGPGAWRASALPR